jgi:hypothetical protein
MIKLVLTGVWVCLVTLASVYVSIQVATRKDDPGPPPGLLGGYETVRGEMTSIPVISDGAVQGYFLTRLSYTVDKVKAQLLAIPPAELVNDVLYSELVGNQVIDFTTMKKFDLERFRSEIKTALNARIGEDVFHDIIIEQIDYLSKDDIRSNLRQGQLTMKAGAPVGKDGSAPVGDVATQPTPAH